MNNDPTDAVIVTKQKRVALVRLNRPETMNALTDDVKSSLAHKLPHVLSDPDVGCIVLTGTGRAFCAGGDVKNMVDRSAGAVRQRMQRTHHWSQSLVTVEKPVVAAVNGACVGAGLSLALLCDIIVSSSDASFWAAFPSIGAVPDAGIGYTLSRAVGLQRAKEILLCNRKIEADEAAAIGLANYVVEPAELLEKALAIGQQMANGPKSLGLTKTLLNRAFDSTFDDYLAFEALMQAQAYATADFAEGVAAFVEKRKPQFPHN